jgi:acyl phosphate:glycerol-3-phosphate acyltransferase
MSWLEQLRTVDLGDAGLAGLGAYVLGCFATGYYLVRALRGQDIRTLASGNTGARNVGRILGRSGFLITTLGDVLKGVLAVWAAHKFFPDHRLESVALLAVVAGHIWPAQLRFRGGKGVATSIGALAAYDWRLLLVYAVVFGCGYLLAHKTVLPGLFAFLCLPGTDYWLHGDGFRVLTLTLLAGLILFAHRKNLLTEIPALNARRRAAPKPD